MHCTADCTTAPAARAARASCRPPARQPAINMPELAEIAASRGHRERGGARPAGASQSRIPSSSIASVCWGWRMNFLPWRRLFFLRTLLPSIFLRSDRPADSISGAAFIQRLRSGESESKHLTAEEKMSGFGGTLSATFTPAREGPPLLINGWRR